MENFIIFLINGITLGIFILFFFLYASQIRRPIVLDLQRLIQDLDHFSLQTEERTRISDDFIRKIFHELHEKLLAHLGQNNLHQQKTLEDFKETIQNGLHLHRSQFDERQLSSFKILQESMQHQMTEMRQEMAKSLQKSTEELSQRVDQWTREADRQLKEMSGQVEKRLSEGFEKTTATFTDIVKRLALIDEAQKKITELSSNVVSLQEVLSDKRSRGAFGEVQLSALIRNLLPEKSFAFQYVLSNEKRADCILFLPPPTGHIVIDAKFPLETYRRMTDIALSSAERQKAEIQFRTDIRKHIQDIANKYILPKETADGAVMFIPAEAIFAEIHAHFPDLVELSHKMRVWMVSPTTMMAILTTARAVLKDEATRQQVHIIQQHLVQLAKNFDRFQIRMNQLARHIHQANDDIEQVHISAKKITDQFTKIEHVELEGMSSDQLNHLNHHDNDNHDSENENNT